jgi:hypothetical protein
MARAPARTRLREAHSDDPHGLGLAWYTQHRTLTSACWKRLSTSGEAKGERENETNELDWTVTAAWVSESC